MRWAVMDARRRQVARDDAKALSAAKRVKKRISILQTLQWDLLIGLTEHVILGRRDSFIIHDNHDLRAPPLHSVEQHRMTTHVLGKEHLCGPG